MLFLLKQPDVWLANNLKPMFDCKQYKDNKLNVENFTMCSVRISCQQHVSKKKLGKGQQKTKHLTNNEINWQKVSIITGYKKSISEVRVGQSLSFCVRRVIRSALWMMFLNLKLQRIWVFDHLQYVISLNDSEENLCVQRTRPILNGHEFRALRQHSIKNRHDSVCGNHTNASKKPQSVNRASANAG